MARLDSNNNEALRLFANRCGCSLDELNHAIAARSVNEMEVISFLAIRGYISQEVFLRMRNEIT